MRMLLLATAAAALAGCGQPQEAAPPPEPQSLFEKAAAMSDMDASLLASQVITQKTDLDPPCVAIREVQEKGVVPDDVAADSIYGPYAGARVFAVQCGERLTTVRARPQDDWLVVIKPGAAEAEVVNCAGPNGVVDQCASDIPRAAPAEAPAADATKSE